MKVETLAEAQKRGHEQVVFFNYPEVGLRAIVSIHSTVLGPSLGGCRMRMYDSESEAIDDVMRLSEGMTYKNSLAGLNIGGGKACIIADRHMTEGREELFTQFGKCLTGLSGRYISAEDMGTSVQDIKWMQRETNFVAGTPKENGGAGDPSPWTALGVFEAIKAVSNKVYNDADLSKRSVSVQGAGHVGEVVIRLLREQGARVVFCDTNKQTVERISQEYGAEAVSLDEIYDAEVDVFCPCAIGQTVNPTTVGRLKTKIIAGAANNQLSDSAMYEMLKSENILYCPDFVINSGGVISVAAELEDGGWKESWVSNKVAKIKDTTLAILDRAEKESKSTEEVAILLAEERINLARNKS